MKLIMMPPPGAEEEYNRPLMLEFNLCNLGALETVFSGVMGSIDDDDVAAMSLEDKEKVRNTVKLIMEVMNDQAVRLRHDAFDATTGPHVEALLEAMQRADAHGVREVSKEMMQASLRKVLQKVVI